MHLYKHGICCYEIRSNGNGDGDGDGDEGGAFDSFGISRAALSTRANETAHSRRRITTDAARSASGRDEDKGKEQLVIDRDRDRYESSSPGGCIVDAGKLGGRPEDEGFVRRSRGAAGRAGRSARRRRRYRQQQQQQQQQPRASDDSHRVSRIRCPRSAQSHWRQLCFWITILKCACTFHVRAPGKTTLLNHILTADHGKRIAVVENEFGDIGIDDALVVSRQRSDDDIVVLLNGCICCTVREDLQLALRNLLQTQRGNFDHIIIETTGMANPGPVIQTFFMDPVRQKQSRGTRD